MGTLRELRSLLLHAALRSLGVRRRRVVAWRAMAAVGARTVTFEREGIVWGVSLRDDDIGLTLFLDGRYQRRQTDAVLSWMQRHQALCAPRDVIVDVGANIGSTCVPLVREAGCRALAIEPVAENFRLLAMNVQTNGLGGRMLLSKHAVQRAPGRITMRRTLGTSGGHFVWRAPVCDGGEYEDVEADGLTALIAAARLRFDEIAFVWADVQGCEADVIDSGAPLWTLGVPLWAEVEPVSLAKQGTLTTFAGLAATHFDRFIDGRDLSRFGDAARAVSIDRLPALIAAITPEQVNTDVLFLPPAWPRR